MSWGKYTLTQPGAFLLDLDGTLYTSAGPVPGATDALRRLRQADIPFRLVTNTTSRCRSLLVQRLAGYGFEVSADELFTATLAGADVARAAGYHRVAPFIPEAALPDLGDLSLGGGTSGAPPWGVPEAVRSEEHTSELQSRVDLVCRLLLE